MTYRRSLAFALFALFLFLPLVVFAQDATPAGGLPDWLVSVIAGIGIAVTVYIGAMKRFGAQLDKLAAAEEDNIWDKLKAVKDILDPLAETFADWQDPETHSGPSNPDNPTGGDPDIENP